jgi:hypothetical protein
MIFQTIFQRNNFKLLLRLSFHKDLQLDLGRGEMGGGVWKKKGDDEQI